MVRGIKFEGRAFLSESEQDIAGQKHQMMLTENDSLYLLVKAKQDV